MKNWYKLLPASILALLLSFILSVTIAGNPPVKTVAGNPPSVKWTVKDPFEQKVFIENKGQYEIKNKVNSGDILYGANQGGLQYYFTANSIWMMRGVRIKRTEKEIEALENQDNKKNSSKKDDEDEKELQYKAIDEFHEMVFTGANAETEITADSEVSWYYNFAITKNGSVKVQAWKKLTYKNLYSGIDMEFYFPQGKAGFEYAFIVHPGADASQIKIQYPLDKSVNLSSDGSISMQSDYGEFIDHAPLATQEEAPEAISCRFIITRPSVVEFNTGNYDKTQTLVIDPWTATPIFSGGAESAFDLDWDDAGNCYVLGGIYSIPNVVIKYNSNGIQLWSYTLSYTPYPCFIGDLTVDRQSQSVYISEGYDDQNGAAIYKVNSAGSLIKVVSPDPIGTDEIWRIRYSSSANILFLSGSGTQQQLGELFTEDTSLTTFSVVDAYNVGYGNMPFYDVWGMALDNFGNGYAAIAGHHYFRGQDFPGGLMVKCPLPSLSPTLWKVNEGYNFTEVGVSYYSDWGAAEGNGFNGMACSNNDLFTYDGYYLKKWDLNSGTLLANVNVEDTFGYYSHPYNWGGLTSDDCGNIFLGADDSINQYNSSLQLINSFYVGGGYPIFDTKLNLNDRTTLYVCGANFVSALTVNAPSVLSKAKVEVTQPLSCVYPYGAATVDTPSVASPSDITWNTTPQQIGNTAINLSAGTYVVTINIGGCVGGEIYDTITIKKPSSEHLDTVSACQGHPVTLTGIPEENNYAWTPSTGISSTNGSSVVVTSPSANATYEVTSTLNGCYDTLQVNLVVNPDPVINVTPSSSSICDGQGVNTFAASGASSYQWSPASGLNETTGSDVTANPSVSTTYTVTGIDSANGCSSTATFDVFIGNQPKASFTLSSPVTCEPQVIQVSNTSSGGSSYLWNFGDDSTSTQTNPQHTYSKAGSYTITLVVTSVPGCTDSISITESIQLGSDNVYVPTAFTPGQESNDYFSPNVVCTNASNYEFKVYNRWGELVYESTDPSQQGWDGRYKGENQPQDTYVYYIELTCNGCKYFKKGDVTLVR